MYLIGLSIGLGVFALTYLFTTIMNYKTRALVVAIVSALCLAGSFFIIGGFSGIPFAVLSVGVLTISLIFVVFGKSAIGKKALFTLTILFIVSYSVFLYFHQVDYWIVKKTQYDGDDDFATYMEHIQADPAIRGYNTFTISEGNQAVVLSLGEEMAGNNIEVLDVEEYGHTTEIKVRTFNNQSGKKNPVIAIGLDRLQSDVVIMDTDGSVYEETTTND